ncbi:outer membrane beta-barrel protein [Paraflavisolibacter sp. H34]|uniref:outer membrane beta-barrel protein n=1 Tax=Huijunlia imazamoxiresistens TaxID=3127457 RepID=UPI00301A966E
MKVFQYSFLLLLLAGMQTGASAQQRRLTAGIGHTTGIPAGNFREITNKPSGRGFEVHLQYGVSDRLSVGAQTGFQDFYQKFPRQLLHSPGSDVSAVISNSVQVIPLMAKGRYRFTTAGAVEPYAALAVGGSLISYQQLYGEVTADQRSKVGFAAQPELGVRLPVGINKSSGFYLAAGYNYMPFRYHEVDGLSHAVIKAGFSFALR